MVSEAGGDSLWRPGLMEQARAALQQQLVELVGEDFSRGLHVVLVRDRWFEPDHYRTKEPSLASVSKVEKTLRPTQTMQERVERMCVVGNSWPLCLLRAVGRRRERKQAMERLLRARARAAQTKARRRSRHKREANERKQARAEAAAARGPATGTDGEGAGDAAAEVEASGPPGESEDAPSEHIFPSDKEASDSPPLPSVDAGRAFRYAP